jgi:plasmid stabilization system protein ParE
MPQKAWSDKDERQYEHIKESAKKRGKSTERAKEIAARTVNKERREEGRTKSGKKSSSGTGNPNRPLEERSKQELYNRAKDLKIEGRSKMSKQELVKAVRKAS